MNNDCPIVNNPFTDPDHENDLIIQMVATGKYLIFREDIFDDILKDYPPKEFKIIPLLFYDLIHAIIYR